MAYSAWLSHLAASHPPGRMRPSVPQTSQASRPRSRPLDDAIAPQLDRPTSPRKATLTLTLGPHSLSSLVS